MAGPLRFGIPSKGRLMEAALGSFERAGMPLRRSGQNRGYRGVVEGREDIEVAFLSATEIAYSLGTGRLHLGVTGEDLIREIVPDADNRTELLLPLGFGFANVVVAVPDCWIDVARMGDLEEAAELFYRTHGRALRVATKYANITRRFFAEKEIAGYRIVESAGATEGAPASGAAELIVDITTSGATLRANHLKVLEDGVILRSQAHLVASRVAAWERDNETLRDELLVRLHGVIGPI